MRGDGIEPQPHMWSYVPPEQRIQGDHPLRPGLARLSTGAAARSSRVDPRDIIYPKGPLQSRRP